jgi:hypothetical protein
MVTKNVQPLTVFFVDPFERGGHVRQVFDKGAIETAGLVIFEEKDGQTLVRMFPWHMIQEVWIGRHEA